MMKPRIRTEGIVLLILFVFSLAVADCFAQRGGNRGGGGGGGGGAQGTYYPNTMIGEAMISSDPETRRLIVITDEETNLHISQVITNLDRPKPQVLIKVVFLEVTYTDNLDFGIEGSYTRNMGNSSTGLVSNVFGLAALGATPLSSGGLYQVLGSDFNVTMRALAEAGKLEVLSRPSILARNNQQATISVGQSIPLVTGTQAGGLTGVQSIIQYQDVGIILRVTPFITSNGLVEMIVAPEISTLTAQTIQVSETVNSPVIARRYAETVVVTPHGQTVVIGGLMESNKTVSERKIPLLGDIPILGNLFKRKIKEDIKTELIIFLTPYVVANTSELAEMTRSETRRSSIMDGSFSEKELDKFMDGLPERDPSTIGIEQQDKKGSNRSSKGK